MNISRHTKEVHGWADRKAKYTSSLYGLRKSYVWKNGPHLRKRKIYTNGEKTYDVGQKKPKKDSNVYRKKRSCPVISCFSINKRMSLHLQEVHKIKKGSEKYYELLKEAAL